MTESFNLPEDLVKKLWALYQDLWDKYPDYGVSFSREQLQSLICNVYQASLTTDEGRKLSFQLNFPKFPQRLTLRFDPPLACSAHQLIKLAPAVGIGNKWIVVFPVSKDSDQFIIVGICDPELTQGNVAPHNRWGDGLIVKSCNLSGITLSVFGPGQIRVAIDSGHTLELHNCRITEPYPFHSANQIQKLFSDIANSLIPKLNAQNNYGIPEAVVRQFWTSVIRKTVQVGHGGCFIFVPVEFSQDLINPRYKLKANYLEKIFVKKMNLYPWIEDIRLSNARCQDTESVLTLCDAHFIERDFARACSLLASLAQVDGAVIIRKDLTVECFGAELIQVDQPEQDEPCDFWIIQENRSISEPLRNMGMRHRSAYRFCQKIPGSIAFVVSQDGGIRIFCGIGDSQVKAYKDLSADEWFIP